MRRRRTLLAAAGTLVVSAAALLAVASCRPAWYRPSSIDFNLLEADKHAALGLVDAIGDALNRGRSYGFVLDGAQINRWLTARREIWPDAHEVEAGRWLRPQVDVLSAGRVRVAALLNPGALRAVVSVTLHLAADDDELTIRCDGVRIGALPVPVRLAVGQLAPSVEAVLRDGDRLDGGELKLANHFVWRNGRRPFRVGEVSIEAGRVHVRIDPL